MPRTEWGAAVAPMQDVAQDRGQVPWLPPWLVASAIAMSATVNTSHSSITACGKLALGKAGPPRGGDRADVHQQLDAGMFELIEHALWRRLFIADGEEFFRSCHLLHALAG